MIIDHERTKLRRVKRWFVCLGILVGLCVADYLCLTDPRFKDRSGYGFGYAGLTDTRCVPRYGPGRVLYNFRHFWVFWRRLPPGRHPSSVGEWLTVDGNRAPENVGHFLSWGLMALLMRLLGFSILQSFLTPSALNIAHEFIIEGLYVDPSFLDLWLDEAGTVIGVLLAGLLLRGREHHLREESR